MWPGSWEWEREICLAELPQLSRESSAARYLAKRSADALNDYRIRKCGGCLSRRLVSSFPCHRHHRRLSLSLRSASAQFITPNAGRSIYVLTAYNIAVTPMLLDLPSVVATPYPPRQLPSSDLQSRIERVEICRF